jgi:hypothetical protein
LLKDGRNKVDSWKACRSQAYKVLKKGLYGVIKGRVQKPGRQIEFKGFSANDNFIVTEVYRVLSQGSHGK